ncbi:hypothetical protein ACFDTO_16855 [Microbacteriaceae bacterium 4G12]
MGAVIWKRIDSDRWMGDDGGRPLGEIVEADPHRFLLRNEAGAEIGSYLTLRDAQRGLLAERSAPPADVGTETAPRREDVLDIDQIGPDLARVRVDLHTIGFVRKVGRVHVALGGPTLHLAVEEGQFYFFADAVRCLRSQKREY